MKKVNLKEVDFKDKKFIFPLIIAVIVIFIGWFVFGAIADIQKNEDEAAEEETEETSEIQSVPIEEGAELMTRTEALNEQLQAKKDYTAMQGLYDPTIIEADTTIYTQEELAYIDSLQQITSQSQAEVDALNQQIYEQNQGLSDDMRSIGNTSGTGVSAGNASDTDPDESLREEMIMYQKLINGEEILTPEQEQARREEQIRQEERQKVIAELNAQETVTVEKAGNVNPSAFNTVMSADNEVSDLEKNTIKAMVDQTVKVEQGSRVRFVLLEDIRLGNEMVAKGSLLYGSVSGLQSQRIKIAINGITVNGRQLPVKLQVLDVDGIEGLYVPKSSFREAAKTAASQAVQGGQMNISTSPDNFVGMAAQALQNAYQSVTAAVSGNISKEKATIKYNTIVYLLNNETR